ncbi:hypothetical protein [Anaeromyxobacter oryzae]|uniref:hypothetical protein n=1 Tax=Anaeromyxobacter oryzae TaxID=2918170 RepID=UPI0020BE0381|nr:hypothetical protein [Anaeromyxobacter oryzae]
MISTELAGFLQSGISILVGTRDARLFPDCVRAVGARCAPPGELTIFLPDATAGTCIANARDNGRVAATFSRAHDHRSIQVKGRAIEVRPCDAAERAAIDAYRCAWAQELAIIGMPPRVTLRMSHWPAHAVRLRVEAVYVQTPGPGAGAPLVAPEAGR